MINQAQSGFDPRGNAITKETPDRPGFFLSRRAAEDHLAEWPHEFRAQWLRRKSRGC